MRRLALALLLPLPIAALPLLILAFPAPGNGSIGDARLTNVSEIDVALNHDEALMQRTNSSYGDTILGCDDDLSDQS